MHLILEVWQYIFVGIMKKTHVYLTQVTLGIIIDLWFACVIGWWKINRHLCYGPINIDWDLVVTNMVDHDGITWGSDS